MREFKFGLSKVKVTSSLVTQLDSIARRHGFKFVEAWTPDTKSWFSGQSKGMPLDQLVQAAIEKDVHAAGLQQD